jgi:hypothetical protein
MILLNCLLLAISQGIVFGLTKTNGDPLMFDLLVDPNEENYVDITDSDYVKDYNNLVERSEYWAGYVIDTVEVNITLQKTAWREANGISTWLETAFEEAEIEQIYDYKKAPHIVFVLVDDWVSQLS